MCHKKRRKTADLRFFFIFFCCLETCRIANVRFNRRFALKIKNNSHKTRKRNYRKALKSSDNKNDKIFMNSHQTFMRKR